MSETIDPINNHHYKDENEYVESYCQEETILIVWLKLQIGCVKDRKKKYIYTYHIFKRKGILILK